MLIESVQLRRRPAAVLLDVAALGLDAKGDAADWLAAHPEATAADVLALARENDADEESALLDDEVPIIDVIAGATDAEASTHQDSPNAYKYGGGQFELSPRGVHFIGTNDDGNAKAPIWICSPIGVIAKTRDAKSGEWGRLLEWFDDDGVQHQWAMPLELLEGDGIDVRRELARLGLHMATSKSARDLLAAYIKVWPVEQRARCVARLGWHGSVFATPSATIGEAEEHVVFQNAHAIEPALSVRATVDGWRETVARMANGNTRLVFAISLAFAGTLAGIVAEDSGGFHMRGKSSSGKSIALKAAASVWGEPTEYVRMWRSTTNGLEGLAALHNDGLLILDEISQCDPKEVGELAYLLANGQGKARAAHNGTARAAQRWRLLFLSAGEESLSSLMARVGKKANAGQEIRLADFDADAGAEMGVLEALNGHATSATLIMAIKEAAARSHGAVGLEWLRCVVRDQSVLAGFITDGVRQFVEEVMPACATGQVERVAGRFALVAVAGELATHYTRTGWAQGEAEKGAKACFKSWLDSFGGGGDREERVTLMQVKAFFESHGASRFEDIAAPSDQRVINRAGFYRNTAYGEREYLVLPQVFRREIFFGIDEKAAEKLLVAKGWIAVAGDRRPTQKPRLPGMGTAVRVYVFTSKMWEGEE